MTMERKRKRLHYTATNHTTTGNNIYPPFDVNFPDNFDYHYPSGQSAMKLLKESTLPYSPRRRKIVVDTLPYPAEGVEVVYTKDAKDVDTWVKRNIIRGSVTAIGLDIEWKPQFVSKTKGGIENRTAVLQLATEDSCLVVHLFHMSLSSLPKSLVHMLADKGILKVGSGIKGDAVKLMHDTGLFCDGRADIQDYAKAIGVLQSQGLGLKNLAKSVLNIELNKSKKVAMSNWQMYYLRSDQIDYAALDAWIGLKIFRRLKEQLRIIDRNGELEEKLIQTGKPVLKRTTIQNQRQESANMNPTSKNEGHIFLFFLFIFIILFFYFKLP